METHITVGLALIALMVVIGALCFFLEWLDRR